MRNVSHFLSFSLALTLAQLGSTSTWAQPIDTDVETPGPDGALKGTLLSPASDAPIVLMIPGSGLTDRDGNNASGIRAATLKLLAEGLYHQGIASVRIDKRGLFASAAAIPDPNAVTIDDYVTDVHSWIKSIRNRSGAKCVWVLGHSEGGIVAIAAAQDSSAMCGLILVATPGRTFGKVLTEQLEANPANDPIMDQALAAISELEAGRKVDPGTLHPGLMSLFHPAVQDFLISMMAIDPAKLIRDFNKPILILQGERDIQVTLEDAQLLKRSNPEAKLMLLRDTNHVLKVVTSDDREENIGTYWDPSLPLAPGVLSGISDFIRSFP